MISLGLHTECIGSIFVTGIFGNFYTKRGGELLTFRTGIPGGLAANKYRSAHVTFRHPRHPTRSISIAHC